MDTCISPRWGGREEPGNGESTFLAFKSKRQRDSKQLLLNKLFFLPLLDKIKFLWGGRMKRKWEARKISEKTPIPARFGQSVGWEHTGRKSWIMELSKFGDSGVVRPCAQLPWGSRGGPSRADVPCTIQHRIKWSFLGYQRQRVSTEVPNLQAWRGGDQQANLPRHLTRWADSTRELVLSMSCLCSREHSHWWKHGLGTGKQVRLCHFFGCQRGRVTTLNNQIRYQHRWSQSPRTMMPMKSLEQKYHPGKKREKDKP